MPDKKQTPNQWPVPPILLVAVLFAAYLTQTLLPWGWHGSALDNLGLIVGLVLIISAFAIDIWAFRTFQRHQTTIMPNKGASNLATDGPFKLSRNPIYLGNIMLTIGGGFVFSSYWFFIGAIVLALALREMAIKPEEQHLAANFPEAWQNYKAKTRRWL